MKGGLGRQQVRTSYSAGYKDRDVLKKMGRNGTKGQELSRSNLSNLTKKKRLRCQSGFFMVGGRSGGVAK